MNRFRAAPLAIALLFAGCADPTDPGAAGGSVLAASLAGAIAGDYRGDGRFYAGQFEDGSPQLSIWSKGQGESDGSSFRFHGVFDGVPAPGRYAIVPQPPDGYPSGSFVGAYTWRLPYEARVSAAPGDLVAEYYTAVSGWVDVIRATGDGIEGRFEMVARRYCRMYASAPDPEPCDLFDSDYNATVESSGEFLAMPYDEEVWEQPG